MKQSLLILLLIVTTMCFSQETDRIEIKGKVVVDNNDIEGITVFNSSSNRGTITNEKGEFKIDVKLNDLVEFAAIQFKNFTVIIDNDVISTRQMTVYLVEQINKLDEVLILPYDLTGNLTTDIESVRTFNPDLDALYFGIRNSDEYQFPDDYRSGFKNTAMHSQSEPIIVNGLNVINVVKLLISPLLDKSDRKLKPTNTLDLDGEPEDLKDFYSIAFISANFDIPTERVDEFISFLKKEGLNDRMIKKDRELELLQFMYSKRDEFLERDANRN